MTTTNTPFEESLTEIYWKDLELTDFVAALTQLHEAAIREARIEVLAQIKRDVEQISVDAIDLDDARDTLLIRRMVSTALEIVLRPQLLDQLSDRIAALQSMGKVE